MLVLMAMSFNMLRLGVFDTSSSYYFKKDNLKKKIGTIWIWFPFTLGLKAVVAVRRDQSRPCLTQFCHTGQGVLPSVLAPSETPSPSPASSSCSQPCSVNANKLLRTC